MPPEKAAFLLVALACTVQLTYQQSKRWISDTEIFYREKDLIYDTITGNTTSISNYTFNSYSRDLSYGAWSTIVNESLRTPNRKRMSMIINDISRDVNYTVGLGNKSEVEALVWSHGSAYSYIFDDELYYVASPEQSPVKVTNHEESGQTMVGPFAFADGKMWFSPSDKFLGYTSASANSTKKVMIPTYDRADKYDYNYIMDYSKAGTSYTYLFDASWVVLHGKEHLLAIWSNRWQNETALTLCSYENATCDMLYEYKYNHSQFASFYDYANIVHSDSAIFILLPEVIGDNAWQHIAKIEISAENRVESISFLPSGEYEVRHIIAYRHTEDIVIYDAQAPHPWNRHIYGTPAGNSSLLKTDKCLSCGSANCTFQESVEVSKGSSLKIALLCKGQSPSYDAIIDFNSTLDLQEMRVVKLASSPDNATEPSENREEMPEMTTETFLLPSGFEAIVRIYHGDPNLTSVPVTLNVYGGAMDFNKVTDEYDPSPMPIEYKHAIVYIDVRGCGGRGWKYRSATYGRLVTVEVEDTIEAMKMVLEKYQRFDKKRVGVFGWSYGGTMSIALTEAAPQSFFKCAISVAPVTNFLYYKAWYSDRFMGDASPSSFTDLNVNVTAFNQTKLLLVHGLRDENVLFQNSAIFIEALQQADITFEVMVYPNQDHSINRGLNPHLKHLFMSFLAKCYA